MANKKRYIYDTDDMVFTPYITKNGKRIYHPTGIFAFPKSGSKPLFEVLENGDIVPYNGPYRAP